MINRAWENMSTPAQDESGAPPVAVADAGRASAIRDGEAVGNGEQQRRPRWVWRLAWTAGTIAAGVVLYLCYLHVSRTEGVLSDGASNALQAWDMLHGNPLLRGWTVTDVSFYTTELPEYMLVEAVRGLHADVLHISAAITYTLVVLAAGCWPGGGRRAGRVLSVSRSPPGSW